MFGKKQPYNPNLPSRRLNKDFEFIFDRGWSPILKPVIQNHKVYLQLIQWVSGEGEQPFDPTTNTYYLGPNGLVNTINDAVNIAEDFITTDYMDDIVSVTNLNFTLTRDIAPNNYDIYLNFNYKDLAGTTRIAKIKLFTDNIIQDSEINTTSTLGASRKSIAQTLKDLKQWIIIDDYTIEPFSHNQALSHFAVMQAIDEAKARFQVPLVNLTTDIILEAENTHGIDTYNPYYMLVASDERKGGYHSVNCTEPCNDGCLTMSFDGGYEERGNRPGIEGCICTPLQEEIQAICRVTITQLGNVGDRYEVILNDLPYTFYNVQSGDTTQDVVAGLIANLPNECTTGRDCTVINITSNSFDLLADAGLGSTPNSWSKDVVYTGNARLTFVQIRQGVDYVPATYRGVTGCMIAYDGEKWYNFGPVVDSIVAENGLYREANRIGLGGELIKSTLIYGGELSFSIKLGSDPDAKNEFTMTPYSSFFSLTNSGNEVLGIGYKNYNLYINDSISEKGIDYTADYSANYTDRTLIDRGYLNNFLTFQNGITKTQSSISPLLYDVELGGELVKNTYIYGNYSFAIHSGDDNGTTLSLNSSGFTIGYDNVGGDVNVIGYNNGFYITDDIYQKGIAYSEDYSNNYTDRTLIDRAYLHNSLTFNNGLTKYQTDNSPLLYDIRLGGSITQSQTNLIGDKTNSFTIDEFAGIFLQSRTLTQNAGLALEDGTIILGNDNFILTYNPNSVIFEQLIHSGGIQYNDDYSADYTDRSLVDKEYVDNLITASNGLTRTLNNIKLGGSLVESTIITDNRITKTGIEYGGDYSVSYTNRSLVDKEYVDNVLPLTIEELNDFQASLGGSISVDNDYTSIRILTPYKNTYIGRQVNATLMFLLNTIAISDNAKIFKFLVSKTHILKETYGVTNRFPVIINGLNVGSGTRYSNYGVVSCTTEDNTMNGSWFKIETTTDTFFEGHEYTINFSGLYI